jgi:hypothetical protein
MSFICSPTARESTESEDYEPMSSKAFRILGLATIALAGCAEAANRPLASCQPMVAQICSNAAETQLHDGTLMVGYSSQPEEERVVPFVVPVFRRDGSLATEVDCYANTDSHTYSIVRSDLAIPPASQESVDFLRDQHLCAYPGSFAKVDLPRVQMASRFSASARSSR